uniref:Tetraspanin 5 n=1 Tax=Rousettus aegyptiacus TaxID=9407 RepID=A0A7J8EBC6_ROUAE|nr:tetraspanin 5 [Rousettus aegyptiacus]
MELCRQTLRCTALAPGGPVDLEEHAWTRSPEMLSALCGNTVISYSNASRERCGVPFSCCTKDPAEDVINTQCGYDARQKPEVDQQIVIYTKGCVPQFEKWLQDNLTIVAGIFIGIALLQIFGICLAQNLVSDIEAVRASW